MASQRLSHRAGAGHRPAGSSLLAGLTAALVLVLAFPAPFAGAARHPRKRRTGPTTVVRKGRPGPPGPAGQTGSIGALGPPGPVGLMPGILTQSITINWQNGLNAGQDRASFLIPGIGRGEVVCSYDTQWVRVFPFDLGADVVMWTVKQLSSSPTVSIVRTGRITQYTGPDFNEGFNRYNHELMSDGTLSGIISSHGARNAIGGPGPPPTTFRLSWLWDFTVDGAQRCYVAAALQTGPSA